MQILVVVAPGEYPKGCDVLFLVDDDHHRCADADLTARIDQNLGNEPYSISWSMS